MVAVLFPIFEVLMGKRKGSAPPASSATRAAATPGRRLVSPAGHPIQLDQRHDVPTIEHWIDGADDDERRLGGAVQVDTRLTQR